MMRFRIAAVLLGLTVAAIGTEAALRLFDLGFGNSPLESDPFLHHVHPRNYRFIQQHPSGELGGSEVMYDAAGRVVGSNRSHSDGTRRCRLAFMGDSFTEGGQVAHHESFVGRIEAATRDRCEVRNYAVSGYSPAIYLVQWTREVRDWNPTHVFVMVYGNDVADDARYMERAETDATGMPVAIRGPGGGRFVAALRRLHIARYVRMTMLRREWRREWDANHPGETVWTVGGIAEEYPDLTPRTASLVAELDRRVRNSGARFSLTAVPSRYRLMGDGSIPTEAKDFHQKVEEWAGANAIPFLPLDVAFQAAAKDASLFFLHDIHFTAAGHATTADVILSAFDSFANDR